MYIFATVIKKIRDMIEQIGVNAGLVWKALNEGGKLSLKEVKKVTRIKTEKDVFAALGWLAKEGKLVFDESEGEIFVSLT
jgi:hypothetical protein